MPKDQNRQTKFLSLKDLANMLEISEPTARRLVDGRAIPFYKFGGCLRFSQDDVLKFVEKSRIDSLV
jgi:excisionase family DNA binding protein